MGFKDRIKEWFSDVALGTGASMEGTIDKPECWIVYGSGGVSFIALAASSAKTGVNIFEFLPEVTSALGDKSTGTGECLSDYPAVALTTGVMTSGGGTYGTTVEKHDGDVVDSKGNTIGHIDFNNKMGISRVEKNAERVYNVAHGNPEAKNGRPVVIANDQNVYTAMDIMIGHRSLGAVERMLEVLDKALAKEVKNESLL